MRKLLPVLLLFFTIALLAQTAKYPIISIPVLRNGIAAQNAWSGGLNAPQFSPIDLNNDGMKDLFVFDRGGDRVLTFLNDGSHSDTAYHYAPKYEKIFPAMNTWAVIRDYDHDGVPDIFTYQTGETTPAGITVPAGIKVYKGSRHNGNLHFDVVQYDLYYYDAPYTLALWTNSLGLPAIVDVNGDGDLDILAFNIYGTAVIYYENQTVERGISADSMIFTEDAMCWGNFYAGTSISLNVSCKGGGDASADNDNGRHSGSALSAIDNGNDHDIDLLVTNVHSDRLALLSNSGNASYANIGWVDTTWPSCNTPALMPYFAGAYQIDADNDGADDVLVSPILSTPALDRNNVQVFKHASDTCGYRYSGNDSFLVSTMLDHGTDSKGVFFDYNNDGLMDIVVGNYGYYDLLIPAISKLALYENNGTSTQPAYTLITTDYAGISQYTIANGTQGIDPAFGDMDGDGKPDMLLGDANGGLTFFKNNGGQVASYPGITTANYFGINVGEFSVPFIYDVNGDSLPDLVIGKRNGRLSYYWNYGTVTSPLFSADSVNANFGGVNVTLPSDVDGFSQPFINRDSAGNMLLFVGSQQGKVFEYMIDQSKLRSGTFPLLDTNYMHYDAGMKVTMQAADLNGDGKMEYLLGNSLGGLQMFSETLWDSSTVLAVNEIVKTDHFAIFPNPSSDQFNCRVGDEQLKDAGVEVFDLLGKRISVPITIQQQEVKVYSSCLANGMYVVRIHAAEHVYSGKVLIQH